MVAEPTGGVQSIWKGSGREEGRYGVSVALQMGLQPFYGSGPHLAPTHVWCMDACVHIRIHVHVHTGACICG